MGGMTPEEHHQRHMLLHAMFDELVADYFSAKPGSLPSKTTVLELLQWSHEQTIEVCMSCRFYGVAVHMMGGTIPVIVPTHGNQCGLITNAHSPCAMEMRGETPDWKTCPRNPANNGTAEARQ